MNSTESQPVPASITNEPNGPSAFGTFTLHANLVAWLSTPNDRQRPALVYASTMKYGDTLIASVI